MNREIKFRAWHEQGFMLDVENIVKLNLEEEILEYCVLNEDGVRSDRECCFYEIELMQYTGLKDKNGVEIYEGDVLFHPLQGRRKVFYPFSETVASYGLRDIDNGFGSTLQDSHVVWEVIGNICDNPELIEVEDENS